jgi:hypothetical protein
MPTVDVEEFRRSIVIETLEMRQLERQALILKGIAKPVIPVPLGSGDFVFNLVDPRSKSGQVIERFEKRIKILSYDEVAPIVSHLATIRDQRESICDILFDLAWSITPYPFGVRSKRALKEHWIPHSLDLFPAVFEEHAIPPEFAFTPFKVLNGIRWPYSSAVDRLFDMMVARNPFDIAMAYYNVIQEVTECMQKVLCADKGNPDDVPIDFDSLFPVLMICVFVFGVDEWLHVAMYAMSFNEYVEDGHVQLKFAMTYLEGLVTEIVALDFDILRAKAAELRQAKLDKRPS